MQIRHTTDLTSPIYQAALAIRKTVFVAEQHVPVAREVDADEARTIHFVAYQNDQPVGTARLLPEATGFHVQRVAVVKAARGTGVGSALLQALADYAKAHHAQALRLGAQVHAVGFYERLGYHLTARPEFLDAGIRHREMALDLTD